MLYLDVYVGPNLSGRNLLIRISLSLQHLLHVLGLAVVCGKTFGSTMECTLRNQQEWMRVIPRQVSQLSGNPTCTVSDASEKITKNTSMCSNDTNKMLDADH